MSRRPPRHQCHACTTIRPGITRFGVWMCSPCITKERTSPPQPTSLEVMNRTQQENGVSPYRFSTRILERNLQNAPTTGNLGACRRKITPDEMVHFLNNKWVILKGLLGNTDVLECELMRAHGTTNVEFIAGGTAMHGLTSESFAVKAMHDIRKSITPIGAEHDPVLGAFGLVAKKNQGEQAAHSDNGDFMIMRAPGSLLNPDRLSYLAYLNKGMSTCILKTEFHWCLDPTKVRKITEETLTKYHALWERGNYTVQTRTLTHTPTHMHSPYTHAYTRTHTKERFC